MSRMRDAVIAAALEPPRPWGEGGWARQCRFAPDFLGFNGHFPNYPVLPAVVQMQAAVALIEAVCNRRLHLRQIDNAKFLIQLHADELIEVRCRAKEHAGRTVWEASLQVDAGTAAQFLLRFEEGEAAC